MERTQQHAWSQPRFISLRQSRFYTTRSTQSAILVQRLAYGVAGESHIKRGRRRPYERHLARSSPHTSAERDEDGQNAVWNRPEKTFAGPRSSIVGRIDDELIIDGKAGRGGERVALISLDDLLKSRVRQLPVSNEDTQSSGIQESLVHAGDSVDDAGNSDGVVPAVPKVCRRQRLRQQRCGRHP